MEKERLPEGRQRSYKVRLDNALDFLGRLPDGSIDLIVTDPPYESMEKHRDHGTTTRLTHSKKSSNDWFKIFDNQKIRELLIEFWRVLKRNTYCYIFVDWETALIFRREVEIIRTLPGRVNFNFWTPLVWHKIGRPGMGYHYRSQYELVLLLEKGHRNLNDWSVRNVLEAKRVERKYPAEKPVSLIKTFVRLSSNRGELVLDPFCGSGSALEASVTQGRRFIGCDISPKAVALSRARGAEVMGYGKSI